MTAILNTDGGSRGNPGPAATGIVLKTTDGEVLASFGTYLGVKTNNEAEYIALLSGIEAALEKKILDLECFLDSELVVKQLNGQYKVKEPTLKVLWSSIKNLEGMFQSIKFTHVRREKNKEADKIVNETLDAHV
jgi:ribonuclease HI